MCLWLFFIRFNRARQGNILPGKILPCRAPLKRMKNSHKHNQSPGPAECLAVMKGFRIVKNSGNIQDKKKKDTRHRPSLTRPGLLRARCGSLRAFRRAWCRNSGSWLFSSYSARKNLYLRLTNIGFQSKHVSFHLFRDFEIKTTF